MGRLRRPLAWVALVTAAVAGIGWTVAVPSDVSYLLGPFAAIPLAVVSVAPLQDRFEGATRRQLVALWLAAVVLAIGGGAWALALPGERSYAGGSLMALPVLLVTPLLDRGRASDARGDSGLGGDQYGLPPF